MECPHIQTFNFPVSVQRNKQIKGQLNGRAELALVFLFFIGGEWLPGLAFDLCLDSKNVNYE
jgi:hypothetical protein